MMDALTSSFAVVIISIISLYKWIIIISALLSWVQPDPYNPIVQMLSRATEPAYALVRKFIPTTFGGLDLAPMVLIFAILFLETFVSRLFMGMM